MDLLDRLLGHDAWTTGQLLAISLDLPDEDLDEDFDLGLRSIRATLEHIVRNMEVWTDLMNEVPLRDVAAKGNSVAGLQQRLDKAAGELAQLARGIAKRNAWDDTWLDTLDEPPRKKSFGGAIAHVLTHSMHHRSQAIHMLRRLGVENVPEGDALSFEQAARERGTH